jgi:hypothetical protein
LFAKGKFGYWLVFQNSVLTNLPFKKQNNFTIPPPVELANFKSNFVKKNNSVAHYESSFA